MDSQTLLFLALALRNRDNRNGSLGIAETLPFVIPGLPPIARTIGVINLQRKLEDQSAKLANDLQAALVKAGGKLDEKIVTASPELNAVVDLLPEDKKTAIIKLAANAARN